MVAGRWPVGSGALAWSALAGLFGPGAQFRALAHIGAQFSRGFRACPRRWRAAVRQSRVREVGTVRKFLRYDVEARELWLVYADLWDGQHERTGYRVTGDRGGAPLRGSQWAEMDGRVVSGRAPDLYLAGSYGAADRAPRVWTESAPVGPTVKIPCPRASNARRKCAACQEEAQS